MIRDSGYGTSKLMDGKMVLIVDDEFTTNDVFEVYCVD